MVLANFEPIEAPKTLRQIKEDQLNKKKVEIILKNYDEVLRKGLIKYESTEMVFGFIIKMITDDPINKKRDFMLKYYLEDTDFAIYEYRETNSGEFIYSKYRETFNEMYYTGLLIIRTTGSVSAS